METGQHAQHGNYSQYGRQPPTFLHGSAHADDSAQVHERAVVILDRTANVTSWNDEAELLFGYPAEIAMGKPIYHFLDLESLAPGSLEWEFRTAYYQGMSTCTRIYRRDNGSRFRATAEVTPLWDGEFLGYRLSFYSV